MVKHLHMFKKDFLIFGAPSKVLGFDEKDTILHKKHELSCIHIPFSAHIKGHTLHFNGKKLLLPCTPHGITMTDNFIIVSCLDQIVVYNLDAVYLDAVEMENNNYFVVAVKNYIGVYGPKVLKLFKFERSLKLVVPSRIESRDYKLACFVGNEFICASDHCIVVVKDTIKDKVLECKQWHHISSFLNGFLVSSSNKLSVFLNLEELKTELFDHPITQMVSNNAQDKVAILAEDLFLLAGSDIRASSVIKIKPALKRIYEFQSCQMKPLVALNTSNGPFLLDYENFKYLDVVEKVDKIGIHVSGMYLMTLHDGRLSCWQIHVKDYIMQWEINDEIKDFCISKTGQHFVTFNGIEVKLYHFWSNQILWCYEPPTNILQLYLENHTLLMLLTDKSVLLYNIISGEKISHKYYDTAPVKSKLLHNSPVVYFGDVCFYKNERINASSFYSNDLKGFDKGKILFGTFQITPHLAEVTDVEMVQSTVISSSNDGHLSIWTPNEHPTNLYSKQTFSIESALMKISIDVEKEILAQNQIQTSAELELLRLNSEFENNKIQQIESHSNSKLREIAVHTNDMASSLNRTKDNESTISLDIQRRKQGIEESTKFYEELKEFEQGITRKLSENLGMINGDMDQNRREYLNKKKLDKHDIQLKYKTTKEKEEAIIEQTKAIKSTQNNQYLQEIRALNDDCDEQETKNLQSFEDKHDKILSKLIETKDNLHKATLSKKSLQNTLTEMQLKRNNKYSQRLADQKRIKYTKRSISNLEEDMKMQSKAFSDRQKIKDVVLKKIDEFEKCNYILNSNFNQQQSGIGPVLERHKILTGELKELQLAFKLLTDQIVALELEYSWHSNYFIAFHTNIQDFRKSKEQLKMNLSVLHMSFVFLQSADSNFWGKYKKLCYDVFEKNLFADISDHIDNTTSQFLLEKLQEKQQHFLAFAQNQQTSRMKEKKLLLTMYNDHQILNALTFPQ